MPMRIAFDGNSSRIKALMGHYSQSVMQAVEATGKLASEQIVVRGRADIAGGGNFGPRWQDALQANVQADPKGFTIEVTMTGGPPVSYWRVFEYGATISAKNPSGMLWIPVDKSNKTWPRDYGGGLFRAGNALFDSKTKQPMYLGTPSVTIPQKFHLREIVKQVAKEMGAFYKSSFKK